MIKVITAKAFSCAIEVDEQGKILRAPKFLSNFINLPLSILEQTLKRNKFQSIQIENVEE
jgi:hypothetical protein